MEFQSPLAVTPAAFADSREAHDGLIRRQIAPKKQVGVGAISHGR
jgi:hypothetical protein